MTVVADTGGLYALFDADDQHHTAARKIIDKEPGPIIVPAGILGEIDYLLREFLGIDAELSRPPRLMSRVMSLGQRFEFAGWSPARWTT